MGLGDWINTASNLAGGNFLDAALNKNNPANKIGRKVVDQLINKMSNKSNSFNNVFNKAQQQVAQNNAGSSHFVKQLPVIKPGAYGPMATGMIPGATNPAEAWARLEQFDTNHDEQIDETELTAAIDELSQQQAEQISNGTSPPEVHQTEALYKFATGLQRYNQAISAFDNQKEGISAQDLQGLAQLSGNENKISLTDWKKLDA